MLSVEELYCRVDDFVIEMKKQINEQQVGQPENRGRPRKMSLSEVMTILIMFHTEGYRDFKTFYLGYVCQHLRTEFPNRLRYNSFVERIPETLLPLCLFL